MGSRLSTRKQPPQPESRISSTPKDGIQAPGVSAPDPACSEEEQGFVNKEKSEPWDNDLSSSGSATHADDNEELAVITSIRATDIALDLGRIPATLYTLVQHSGLEWTTENKRLSLTDDLVEWHGSIPIPSDPSIAVYFRIYACFEFQPILGNGELLQELTITAEHLLDCNRKSVPFSLIPEDTDVVYPCSSLSIIVGRQKRESRDSLAPASSLPRVHYSGAGYPGEIEKRTDDGHSALSRYRKHREKRDLERSVEYFQRALDICPLDHPCCAAAQSNLAMAQLIFCQVNDTYTSLDISLALFRDALSARPLPHPDRPSTLIQLAAVHLARFEKWRDEFDADMAEAMLHEAVHLSPADSHEIQAAISVSFRLHAGRIRDVIQAGAKPSIQRDSASVFAHGNACIMESGDLDDLQHTSSLLDAFVKLTSDWDWRYHRGLRASYYRFHHLGELSDLEDAISQFGHVVDLSPDGHPDKPGRLNNLGNYFLTRFKCLEEPNDLEKAVSRFHDAIGLVPDGHPFKPSCLDNLGKSFLARFELVGELNDLKEAISRFRDAVDLTPDGDPHKYGRLNNLGKSFLSRFERLGELNDLEKATSSFFHAANLTPACHPDKPKYLSNLGNSFRARSERLGELSDIDQVISGFKEAVDLSPTDHPDKLGRLSNLGNSFLTRFKYLGELGDLENAISTLRAAYDLTPPGRPAKPRYLNNLGNAFLTRFRQLEELDDLERAISMFKKALDLTDDGHPDRPGRLNNLGDSFFIRFQRLEEFSNLEQAISHQRGAVGLTTDDHPHKPVYLNNLGNSLLTRFEHLGELGDLEEAISRQGDAVKLTPDAHPHKPHRLDSLGTSFLVRFEHFGELGDVEEAISRFRDAVNLTPDRHSDKPDYLDNLGSCLLTRFEHLGKLGDLKEANLRFGEAVNLTPANHPRKRGRLNNLGSSFLGLFKCHSRHDHLEQAIQMLRDAVMLTPDDHPHKPSYLNNLGNSLLARFEHLGNFGDVENAISSFRNAVDRTPIDHPDKPCRLNNLGGSFFIRFERLREVSDLENSISSFEKAVELTPDNHPDKPGRLSNLGSCFLARFEQRGKILENAVDFVPDDHPHNPSFLDSLEKSFTTRFEYLQDSSDLETAISLYSRAALASTGSATARFHACMQWISCARDHQHRSLLHAYSRSIDLLPQIAWMGHSLKHRYHDLMERADVVREAAATALDFGLPETAVEWLEQGRSIVWGEHFQLRSSYDKLSVVHPDHAHRLRKLSTALEQASSTHEKSLSSLTKPTRRSDRYIRQRLDGVANRHRILAIERDKLLQDIRRLPGFEQFLLRKKYSQLRASAHSGPVVILNAAESRCDALVILAEVENVIHVPLPNFTLGRSKHLQTSLKSLLRDAYSRRMGYPVREDFASGWESTLSTLWQCVVSPVLDSLAFAVAGDPTHIFWCPTGSFVFLPIHAAGFYGTQHTQPGHKVSDFIVSSYIPTLSILAPSSELNAPSNGDLHFLAVRQPSSDGQSRLPGVITELNYIKAVLQNSPSARTTLLESSTGTVEEVLRLMKEADWVHFACHGVQNTASPADSGLCLADERTLKLSDITALSRRRGGLAFLSACQTATGDQVLSDEAVHIAAGMLFAGYGGVVGTMWSISDRLAPRLAKDVYEQLFRDGRRPDYREAARALQEAVKHIREGGASFEEWLPFIHVGL